MLFGVYVGVIIFFNGIIYYFLNILIIINNDRCL